MKTVTIHEAKTHLSRLIREAQEGEEIVIARGKRPAARLVPFLETAKTRRFGTAAGQILLTEDFDAPLEGLDGYR